MRLKSVTRKAALLGLGVSLLIIGSWISIPLPFSSIPFTLQVFFLLLISFLFPPGESFLIVLSYLLLGACGFPIFAGGEGSTAVFLGPKGGYLLGFLVAAPVISLLARADKFYRRLLSGLVGLSLIYLLGCAWLEYALGISWPKVMAFGLIPFIPFDLAKLLLALLIYNPLSKALSTIPFSGEGSKGAFSCEASSSHVKLNKKR